MCLRCKVLLRGLLRIDEARKALNEAVRLWPGPLERLYEIERLLGLTRTMELPTLEEAGQLFENIPQLWEEATPEERRKLISPLIERVYVDIDSRLIGAIRPAAAFNTLLDKAMARAESATLTLHSQDETERLQVWSWWRRGRVEPYPKHGIEVLLAA